MVYKIPTSNFADRKAVILTIVPDGKKDAVSYSPASETYHGVVLKR